MLKRIAVFSVFVFCAACGGSSAKDGVSTLVDVVEEPPSENCAAGGKKIITGQDVNGNHKLEAHEVNSETFVCHNETSNDDGPLVQITDIEQGDERCLDGGVLIKILSNSDAGGAIITEEVHQETVLCHNPNNKPAQYKNIVLFPEASSLIGLKVNTLGNALPENKKDGIVNTIMTFTVDGITLNAYGTLSVQGNSSVRYPKKNWKLRFYSDQERQKKLLIKLGNSVVSDKWNFKAEWEDPILLRNAVSYTLWERMVESRNTLPAYEVDNVWWSESGTVDGDGNFYEQTGARGFPYVFPMQVSMDENFYGLGMLMTGHEPRNFNIDKQNPQHMYLEFEGNVGTTSESWSAFTKDDFARIKFRAPKEPSKDQKVGLERLGEFLISEECAFKDSFEEYFDKTNIIDMLLFMEAVYDWDSLQRDNEFVTYDLKKWYILPWDKDATFGATSEVPGVGEPVEGVNDFATTLLFNYEELQEDELLWHKTYHAFKNEVDERYADLRDKGVFTSNNLLGIITSFNRKIPREVREAEYERWVNEWGDERGWYYELTSTTQLVDWYERRLILLDEHFGYKP